MFCAESFSTALVRYLLTVFTCLGMAFSSAADEVVSGRFDLIDHHGNEVSEHSYTGKFRLVFFGFTDCPLVCPTTMADVAKVMRLLGDQGKKVQPLFITIDPKNDTVSRLAAYVDVFHPSIVGLTGSVQQIKQAAEGFNVSYGRAPIPGSEGQSEIFHSTYLYLMDGDGQFVDLIGYGTRPERITEKIRQYIQR